jgi:hypothetical protein
VLLLRVVLGVSPGGEGARMYRVMQRQEVVYGHYKEVVEVTDEINGLLRSRGMAEFRSWIPTFGKANELILELEFPDLATYERESEAFSSDPEIMKVWRSGAHLVVQGSVTTELLEPVPQLEQLA